MLRLTPRAISTIDADTGAVDVLFEDEELNVSVRASSPTRLVVRLEDREELVAGASLDAETTAALAERPGQVRLMRGRSGDWIARYDLLLLDLQSGSASVLLDACAETSTSVFSRDGNLLFYTACGDDASVPDELWVRDLGNNTDTRVDIRVGGWPGWRRAASGHRGKALDAACVAERRIASSTAIGPGEARSSRRYFVIDRDGSARELEVLHNDGIARRGELRRRWRFVDWLDENTLLVSRRFVLYRDNGYTAWSNQAGYLDIATGGIEIFAGIQVEGG